MIAPAIRWTEATKRHSQKIRRHPQKTVSRRFCRRRREGSQQKLLRSHYRFHDVKTQPLTVWAGKESNLLCGSIDFGICQFQYIYLV